jgi:hypothetical protein
VLYSKLWQSPIMDRRSYIRHKVHSPAYTITDTNDAQSHLSEIVDIGEGGMCFQNFLQLSPGESLELKLDLSETGAKINTTARVIWSSTSGRTGVHFQKLSPAALRQLKQWLFVNAVIAYANYKSSQAGEVTVGPVVPESAGEILISEVESNGPLLPDHTSTLTAIAAIKKEIESLGSNIDMALQLLAERAQALTRATGSAIALSGVEHMICRASSGPDAPSPGVLLRTDSGFSGECVRTGRLLHCEDSENDPRVNRESCKALGVRSMVAAPILSNGAVIGILEVFSPQASAFTDSDGDVLRRLAEIIAEAVRRNIDAVESLVMGVATGSEGFLVPPEEINEAGQNSFLRRVLLRTVLAVAVLLLGLVVMSRIPSKLVTASPNSTEDGVSSTALHAVRSSVTGLEGLRQLAEQGDPGAQFAVGTRYATGEDVKLDYGEAARWFTLAAEHGNVAAQSVMAAYYEIGTGVPKDLQKAYFWAILAQANGDKAGGLRASELASRISRQQIQVTQQQADDWIKQHLLAGSIGSR